MQLFTYITIEICLSGGHTTIVKVLLHHLTTPDSINDVDIYGRTCLIQAASGGYVDCASLLIDSVISS